MGEALHGKGPAAVEAAREHWRAGERELACALLEDLVIADPPAEAALLLLARFCVDLGRWSRARFVAERLIARDAGSGPGWYTLGRAYKAEGRERAARSSYRRALLGDPHNPEVLTSLGTILYHAGRWHEALACYRAALARHPAHPGARASVAHMTQPPPPDPARLAAVRERAVRLRGEGRLHEALSAHRELLALVPQVAEVWLAAGYLCYELGELAASLPFFETAAALKADLTPAVEAARRICESAGLSAKARRYGERLPGPRGGDLRIPQALVLDAIQPSRAAVAEARAHYEAALDRLLAEGVSVEDPRSAVSPGAFYLAYHGENDVALQRKASALLCSAAPSVQWVARHCTGGTRRPGRLRIGLISAFLFDHSIGKTTRGLVERLSAQRFEVTLLRITPSLSDAVTERMAAHAAATVELAADLADAREQIAALELDILFFQDIGMEPTSYLLAHARLAPVQCVSFGHPNTTGIPTIDYFVSNDWYEPPEAAAHYSERLFLLSELPTLAYYQRPQRGPERLGRAEFGLSDQDHVYTCPQTLFKIHPDFDAVVCGILERDPDALVVFIRGQYADYTEALAARLEARLAACARRVLYLDAMPTERFLELLAVSDVCLDTLHFNGMNSSLEAFAVGTPIVTLPGRLQRGRHTQAMYRAMGIGDCVARDVAQYIEIAVCLAADAAFAAGVRAAIAARRHVLYEDPRVVSEFERFFLEAAQAAGRVGDEAPPAGGERL